MDIDVLKIKILMAEKGITQSKVADKCALTHQHVSKVLTRGRCTPITAGKIAAGLGVHVSEIIKEVQ